jgi:hypothetical protein
MSKILTACPACFVTGLSPVFWASFRILLQRAVVFLSIYFPTLIFLVLFVSRQKEHKTLKTDAPAPNLLRAGGNSIFQHIDSSAELLPDDCFKQRIQSNLPFSIFL